MTVSGWMFNGIRIFVDSSREDSNQIVPRLQPLQGPTVLQVFGYESDVRTIAGLIVGDVDKDAIKTLRTTGSGYTLENVDGIIAPASGFIIKGVSVDQVHSICQTLRTDLDSNAPVYKIELQVYLDDSV